MASRGKMLVKSLRQQAQDLYDSGMRKIHIAAKLGIDKSTVTKYTPRKQYRDTPKETVDGVIEMFKNGAFQNAIAKKYGLSPATVCKIVKGIERIVAVRKPRRKPKPEIEIVPVTKTSKIPVRAYPGEPVESKKLRGKVHKIKPAIKLGTRKVVIKPGFEVWAKIGESDADVIARVKEKFKIN